MKGFAIWTPNHTGSTGYGIDFTNAINRWWLLRWLHDIAIDYKNSEKDFEMLKEQPPVHSLDKVDCPLLVIQGALTKPENELKAYKAMADFIEKHMQ